MADTHDPSQKPTRAAPPPFVGPPRAGALAPKTRTDRPTLPPFSPPFVKRPSPTVPEPRAQTPGVPAQQVNVGAPEAAVESNGPAWLDDAPNESTRGAAPTPEPAVEWVNPDQPAVIAPPQPATGIEWLDSPTAESVAAPAARTAAPDDDDDVFGWDPAEERAGALDAPPASASLEALKELEPWALPGAEPSASTADDVAAALERVASRVRSGDLFVPGAMAATSEEAVLAAVLAALLQRARG
jgi:hypothetical protein